MQDSRKFLYSSDYPTPAIVWKYEGAIEDIPTDDVEGITIQHGLPFIPLLQGVWSMNANFEPAFNIADSMGDSKADTASEYMRALTFGSTATTVHTQAINKYHTPRSMYFKIFAYAPPDYSGEVPIVGDNTRFALNTDYNAPKIIKQGYVDITDRWQEVVIPHGLGYVPQVKVWGKNYLHETCEQLSTQWPLDTISGNYEGSKVDSQNLTIYGDYTGRYYYHIYGDPAYGDS